MRFDVITLFPELFTPFLTQGVTRRAFESGQVDVRCWPLRDFADDRNLHGARFYRIINEVPTVFMIGIVILVIVKPF